MDVPISHEDNPHPLTRRQFIQAASVSAATLAATFTVSSEALGATLAPDRVFEHGNPLKEFSYGDVSLAPCPQQAQFEQTHGILMGLDEDSLLRPFRRTAGLPAPGIDLFGWYSTEPFTGETFGQWVSALSRYYAATRDPATHDKIKRLVQEFAPTIKPDSDFYKKQKAYGHDKQVIGLLDAWRYANIDDALPTLAKVTEAALPYLPGRAVDFLAPEMGAGESYTLAEHQFLAWQSGAGQRHFDIAKQYLHEGFFDSLAQGQNVLARRHVNSHVLSLSSAAKAYLVLGDEKYLKAAVNGLTFMEQQSWVTGAYGFMEFFMPMPINEVLHEMLGVEQESIDTLNDALIHAKHHFETGCLAYAHFKLTRYLLRITKNPYYGDSMERMMYNTALGALPLSKFGNAFYQSNYHSHAHKEYFDGYGNYVPSEWPCCSGTLPQLATDYGISTYFGDAEGIYVNLYMPSTLRFERSGTKISLTQSGQYPLADDITFRIETSHPAVFAVRLRIPAWAQAPSIRVNGKPISEPVRPGTFATLKRKWHSDDRIELELPRKSELKAVDAQHPDTVALVNGPLVLFSISDDTPKVTRAQLLAAKQKVAGSEEWFAESATGPLRLLPWWAIKHETYFTYLSV